MGAERVELRGTLRAVAPLFVGDPNRTGPYDRMVMRDPWGAPFIPASTLRGALRASLDAQLAALGRRAGAPRGCGGGSREGREGAARACALEGGPCDVCRLFGSRGHSGRVTVWDSSAVREEVDALSDLRVAVPRNRDLGTARRENRTEWEVVRAGTVFEFRVEVVVDTELDVGLVAVALDGLTNGVVAVGGGRGRGFGRVEAVVSSAHGIDFAAFVRGDAIEPGPARDLDAAHSFLDPHLARVRTAAALGGANV